MADDKKKKSKEKKLKAEDISLGTGMAEKAKQALQGRNKQLQDQMDAIMGIPRREESKETKKDKKKD